MADRTRKEVVEHLWNKSDHHRGKRLALWVKEGKTRKERALRAEAAERFAKQHAHFSAGEYRRWKLFHGIRVWMSKWAKRIRRNIRRSRHPKPTGGLGGVNVTAVSGSPHWGGGGDVETQFVIPFMYHRGLGWSSHKRTPQQNAAVGGSPNSDHLTTHTSTDAYDFPTYSGEDDARALALALGITNWSANSYAEHYVTIDGYHFRVQILWGAAIGHGDHVHVGIGS